MNKPNQAVLLIRQRTNPSVKDPVVAKLNLVQGFAADYVDTQLVQRGDVVTFDFESIDYPDTGLSITAFMIFWVDVETVPLLAEKGL